MNKAMIFMNIGLTIMVMFSPVFVLVFLALRTWFPDFKDKITARIYKNLCSRDSEQWKFLEEKRKSLLNGLGTLKSSDRKLQEENAIRVLEFGVGPGVNLYCYPPRTHLVAVDINKHFYDIFVANTKKHENVILEKFIVTSAHQMNEVESNSIDAVVCTYTFCSVDDQLAVAEEVKRVLVPGGKFYLFELVGYQNIVYRRIQQFFRPLWRIWFNNWRLGYDPVPILKKAGFVDVELDYFEPKELHFLVRPNVTGTAKKP